MLRLFSSCGAWFLIAVAFPVVARGLSSCGSWALEHRLYSCSQEIKRCLLLGRKAVTNPDSVLKSRDITLSTKFHIVKAMVFPVVRYGCESGTIRNAEHQRIDALLLRCWSRLLDYKKIEPVNPKGNQP